MEELAKRLKTLVSADRIHLANCGPNGQLLITETYLSDFPDWPSFPYPLVGLTERKSTIFFKEGKPSHIDVEVVVQVDAFYLELDPKDPNGRPGVPISWVDRDLLARGVMDDAYMMLNSPPKFDLITEEFIVNLREPLEHPESRFKLRLVGTRAVKDEKELFYILKSLSRPDRKQ